MTLEDIAAFLLTVAVFWMASRYASWSHTPRLTPEERAHVNRMLDKREREQPGSTRGRL